VEGGIMSIFFSYEELTEGCKRVIRDYLYEASCIPGSISLYEARAQAARTLWYSMTIFHLAEIGERRWEADDSSIRALLREFSCFSLRDLKSCRDNRQLSLLEA
jgi:hypothetical protein